MSLTHNTFFLGSSDQSDGRFCSRLTPIISGPRQYAQSPANAFVASAAQRAKMPKSLIGNPRLRREVREGWSPIGRRPSIRSTNDRLFNERRTGEGRGDG